MTGIRPMWRGPASADVERLRSDALRATLDLDAAAIRLARLADFGQRSGSPAPSKVGHRERRVDSVNLLVSYPNLAALLKLEDQLLSLPGVERVVVAGAKNNRATIQVEFRPPGGPATVPGDPTVVCVECGATVSSGGSTVSHGLCPGCAADFIRTRQATVPSS